MIANVISYAMNRRKVNIARMKMTTGLQACHVLYRISLSLISEPLKNVYLVDLYCHAI